jgi:hypothetical protein
VFNTVTRLWPRNRPARLAVISVAVLVTGLAIAAVVVTGARSPGRRAVSATEADALAHRACVLSSRLIDAVSADSSTTAVLRLADQARGAADDAAYGSPRWVQLDAAVQALTHALHVNDGQLAAVGMQQIGPACAPTGLIVH